MNIRESRVQQIQYTSEVIIVDDGSTDNTYDKIKAHAGDATYIRQENSGSGVARNTGIRAASGTYIALLDHDDLWDESFLSKQVEIAESHRACGLVACDGIEVDGEEIVLPHLIGGVPRRLLAESHSSVIRGDYFRFFVASNFIAAFGQTLIPRHVFDRIGPIVENRNEPPDYEYFLRVSRQYPIVLSSESLVRKRYVGTNRSGVRERRYFEWFLMGVPVLLIRQLNSNS